MATQRWFAGATLVAAVVGFTALAVFIGLVIDAPHLLLLRQRNAETLGRVLRQVPDSHGAVEIEYAIGGKTYRQVLPPHGLALPITGGQTTPVYYDPKDPRIAFTAPPGEILTEELPAWAVGSLFGAVAGVLVVSSLRRPVRSRLDFRGVNGPRILSAGVSLGVLVSVVTSAFFGTLKVSEIVGGVLALSGCVMLLRLAWWRRLTWADLLRSREFWLALALVVVANIVSGVV